MTEAELTAVIEKAFDYRGDVTVDIKDGRQVVGYLSNRNLKGAEHCPEPFIEVMVAVAPDFDERPENASLRSFLQSPNVPGDSKADYVHQQLIPRKGA